MRSIRLVRPLAVSITFRPPRTGTNPPPGTTETPARRWSATKRRRPSGRPSPGAAAFTAARWLSRRRGLGLGAGRPGTERCCADPVTLAAKRQDHLEEEDRGPRAIPIRTEREPILIGYTYDDGGRSDAGFKGDTGDCAVRAIAILTRTPYADVYERMAACMRIAGYGASGNAYRQRPRRDLKPAISARDLQNLVKTSYGLHRVKLGHGPRPTYSEGWALHGDCLVGTARHVAAIVDGDLRDTFDGRFYDGTRYGGTPTDERKAQSIWIPARLEGRATLTPEFDPSALIPRPKRR